MKIFYCHFQNIEELKKEDRVVLIGDGRCDSPGHSAKYCIYSVMNANDGKVVETEVVAKTEVSY